MDLIFYCLPNFTAMIQLSQQFQCYGFNSMGPFTPMAGMQMSHTTFTASNSREITSRQAGEMGFLQSC